MPRDIHRDIPGAGITPNKVSPAVGLGDPTRTTDRVGGAAYGIDSSRIAMTLDEKLVTANTLSVQFQNIDQSFKHLEIVWQAGTYAGVSGGIYYLYLRFNGDLAAANYETGGNYFATAGPVNNAGFDNANAYIRLGLNPNFPSGGRLASGTVTIPNYTSRTMFKTASAYGMCAQTGGQLYTTQYGGQWFSRAAITNILLANEGPGFVPGSVFTLYGRN